MFQERLVLRRLFLQDIRAARISLSTFKEYYTQQSRHFKRICHILCKTLRAL